jgi:disulfide bond formation protein DsbB
MALLQAGGGYAGDLLNGDVFQALIGPFVDVLGIPLSALIFFGAIGSAYYAVSGRVVMPMIMLILVGGVTLSFAPPSAARFGIIVLILGLASVGYLAWREATSGP